jgi:hypothetical protein
MVVVLAVAGTFAGVLAARGDAPALPGVGGTTAVTGYPSGTVFTASSATSDKQGLLSAALTAVSGQAQASAPDGVRTLNHNEWLYADGDKSISPAAGKAGQIRVSGQTFATVPFWDIEKNHASYSLTESLVAWTGTSPFTADTITQTDNWITDTYGGSIPKVTGGPSGAVRAAPGSLVGTLVWKSQVSDNWISLHRWSGFISVTTTGVVYQVGYSVTGTFQFGTSFCTVSGQDAADV